VTRSRAVRPRNRLSIPSGKRYIFFIPHRPGGPRGAPGLLFIGYRGFFPQVQNGRGVKLTSHLHPSTEVKNAWSYAFTPLVCLYGVLLN
jgi:hypothetical protein